MLLAVDVSLQALAPGDDVARRPWGAAAGLHLAVMPAQDFPASSTPAHSRSESPPFPAGFLISSIAGQLCPVTRANS
jgi:hypothetical protein